MPPSDTYASAAGLGTLAGTFKTGLESKVSGQSFLNKDELAENAIRNPPKASNTSLAPKRPGGDYQADYQNDRQSAGT